MTKNSIWITFQVRILTLFSKALTVPSHYPYQYWMFYESQPKLLRNCYSASDLSFIIVKIALAKTFLTLKIFKKHSLLDERIKVTKIEVNINIWWKFHFAKSYQQPWTVLESFLDKMAIDYVKIGLSTKEY